MAFSNFLSELIAPGYAHARVTEGRNANSCSDVVVRSAQA